jgi:integrase
MPAFMEALRAQEGIAARALEFTILTAARTGESIGATWKEINWKEKHWTIPANRMKAGKEHRVPLCDRALAILQDMKPADNVPNGAAQFIFTAGNGGRPLSNMSFLMLLRRMNWDNITVHGFRSSFRDWAAERTNFPSDVAESWLNGRISAGRKLLQRSAKFCHCDNVQMWSVAAAQLRTAIS